MQVKSAILTGFKAWRAEVKCKLGGFACEGFKSEDVIRVLFRVISFMIALRIKIFSWHAGAKRIITAPIACLIFI
ncbi:hypothetical protein C1H71_05425 [Iodobacter fluviatilis]|uniref:Uncharacterized protein n=1 Tax=Iodobacter fluviatilis TaxID=537 RepID=A0A7G3G742_9NEIS|nr:hypothetical protein C1H71_05425 [Iodobacter fluviatilis]